MLHLGLKFAFEVYGSDEGSLDVFDSNMQAYYCNKSVGFVETGKQELCEVGGYRWNYIEMVKKSEKGESNKT